VGSERAPRPTRAHDDTARRPLERVRRALDRTVHPAGPCPVRPRRAPQTHSSPRRGRV